MASELPLKKHMAVCYHCSSEALVAGFVKLAKEDTKTNSADALTKLLTGPRRRELLSLVRENAGLMMVGKEAAVVDGRSMPSGRQGCELRRSKMARHARLVRGSSPCALFRSPRCVRSSLGAGERDILAEPGE
jgi:hypothetical protein